MSKNIVFYESEKFKVSSSGALTQESREVIEATIQNLVKNYEYSEFGALTMTKYLIKERY